MQQDDIELSNADVQWHGTRVGLTPVLASAQAKRCADMGERAIAQLIAALTDADSFVAAHVLLTRLSGMEYPSFPAWNGLTVEIAPDATVTIDPDQRFVLARRWERWFRSQPRPTRLPAAE